MSTPHASLAVTALGAATSLGPVAAACAAARAGIVRPAPLAPCMVMDEEAGALVPVTGHPVSFLTRGFVGGARLVRLGTLALQDLLRYCPLSDQDLAETAVLVTVGSGYYRDCVDRLEELAADDQELTLLPEPPPRPEGAAQEHEWMEEMVIREMFAATGRPAPAESRLLFADQPGFARAMVEASRLLVAGTIRRCLVGGIDSLCDPSVIEALQALNLLKGPENPVGVPPGEAAAFALLERADTRSEIRARVDPRTVAVVTGGAHQLSPEAHVCRRLAQALTATYRAAAEPGTLFTVGTHNGTQWAAGEWGRTLVAVPRAVSEARHWFTAVSFGDVGAASSTLALCQVVSAFERRYAPALAALIWASSPRGAKSAFVVSPR